jgi:hypothetical protein
LGCGQFLAETTRPQIDESLNPVEVNRMAAAADWMVRHVGDNCHHEAEDSGAAEAENTMRRCVSQTQGGGEYGILRSCWGFHLKETYQSFDVGPVQRFDIPRRIKTRLMRTDYV